MRCFVLIPFALGTSACWSPGPSEVNPIHYPWHSVTRKAPPSPQGTYCVVALQPAASGITIGGKANGPVMGCTPPAAAAEPKDETIWIMCAPPPEERKKAAKSRKPDCSG